MDAVDVIAAEARCPDGAGAVFPELTTSNATNEVDEQWTLDSGDILCRAKTRG